MVDAATLTALKAGRERGLVTRDFVLFRALTPVNAPIEFGFWSDIEDTAVPILDVRTGATATKNFYGGGSLLSISSIPQNAGLEFQAVTVQLNRSHAQVQNLMLTNNPAAAKCDIYRGVFDAETHLIVSTPTIRRAGKIDTASVTISKVGGVDFINLSIVPTLRELTRINPAKKSHATQKAMRPGDDGRKYEGKKAPVSWGEFEEEPQPETKSGMFGLGWWGIF